MKDQVKWLLTVISCFLFVFAAMANLAHAESYPKEILVGEVLPLSGGAAAVGGQIRAGAEIAAEEINSMGGIKNMGGAKLKLTFGDSKSTPDGGVAEAERLINREKIAVQLGCFQSAVTFPTTEVAQRYKCPHLVNVAVKNEITERGYEYVFRDFNKASYDVQEMVDGAKLFAKETGKGPKTVAFLWEGTDWGSSTHDFMAKLYPKGGYKVVLDESFPPGQSSFAPQLIKIKRANPEMLVIVMYTPDHIIFSKELLTQKLYFPYGVWSVGAGSEDPTFYKAVPQEAVQYMFVQEDGDIMVKRRPFYESINKKVKPRLGYDLNTYVLCGYGTIWVIKNALERTKYDPDLAAFRKNIRDALSATDISMENCKDMLTAPSGEKYCPALVRGIQRVKFDAERQNTHSHGQISQNIDGTHWPMSPVAVRMSDSPPVVWPLPTWDKR
jgi:branched-chain amino acid transport system substrate-binding protein